MLLMKPAWEWTEADIDHLIRDQRPEDLGLDYKKSEALDKTKKDEISKDVSAMANSAGGVLIYGLDESTMQSGPIRFDGGDDPQKVSREYRDRQRDPRRERSHGENRYRGFTETRKRPLRTANLFRRAWMEGICPAPAASSTRSPDSGQKASLGSIGVLRVASEYSRFLEVPSRRFVGHIKRGRCRQFWSSAGESVQVSGTSWRGFPEPQKFCDRERHSGAWPPRNI